MKTFSVYQELIKKNHILIAGSAGSGKSTLIDALIYTACLDNGRGMPTFYLIDPKRIDLRKYRNMRCVAKRVTEADEAIILLNHVIEIMEDRYKTMERNDTTKCNEPDIYVVIDEVADLILTDGKIISPLIQRIAALGRAARIHLVMATQTVLATIISTPIKNNFDAVIALRVATANQSRVILDENGAERLPEHGYGIVRLPQVIRTYELPMIPEEDIKTVIAHFNR